MTIQVGIDGQRKIAASSGKYSGQDGPYWSDDGETWVQAWTKPTPPAFAKVSVFRSDFPTPITAVARWDFYAQKNNGELMGLWKNAGPEQLAKCAESLALRRACPREMAGIVSAVEGESYNAEAIDSEMKLAAEMPRPELEQGDDNVVEGEYREAEPEEAFALTLPEAINAIRDSLRAMKQRFATEHYTVVFNTMLQLFPEMKTEGGVSFTPLSLRRANELAEKLKAATTWTNAEEQAAELPPEAPAPGCLHPSDAQFFKDEDVTTIWCRQCGSALTDEEVEATQAREAAANAPEVTPNDDTPPSS